LLNDGFAINVSPVQRIYLDSRSDKYLQQQEEPMAIELVNIGRIANDGTGDDLREAFTKVNRSLEDLDLRIDDKTEGLNLGAGAGVFKVRNGYDLEFRTLAAGESISVTENANTILFDVDTTLADMNIIADSGAITVPARAQVRFNGTGGVTTSVSQATNSVIISGNASLAADLNPSLSATLNANGNDIVNADLITANNVQSLVHGIDIRNIGDILNAFDFGDFSLNTTNFIDYIKRNVDVEFGTILSPDDTEVDLGVITTATP
jgi:hypothetical protein